jgi:hypothetical protein
MEQQAAMLEEAAKTVRYLPVRFTEYSKELDKVKLEDLTNAMREMMAKPKTIVLKGKKAQLEGGKNILKRLKLVK